jgi:serine/threonine protein kinase
MADDLHDGDTLPVSSTHGPAENPIPVIPDHELIRCIGKGTFGEVWLARTLLTPMPSRKKQIRISSVATAACRSFLYGVP